MTDKPHSVGSLKSHLSAFDLDRTLIKVNSTYSFCKYLLLKGQLPLYTPLIALYYRLKHRHFGLSLHDLHTSLFKKIFKGRLLSHLNFEMEKFVEKHLLSLTYSPVLERLREAQKEGHHTLLISNGPSFIVEKVAQFFQFDEWKATLYDVDEKGRLASILFMMEGKDKGDYLNTLKKKYQLSKENITAYSDSFLDLPFFESAGIPIAVNPDAKLFAFSQKHQWGIL